MSICVRPTKKSLIFQDSPRAYWDSTLGGIFLIHRECRILNKGIQNAFFVAANGSLVAVDAQRQVHNFCSQNEVKKNLWGNYKLFVSCGIS